MSGVIANVARLKPELRLAEAISQFEASLSSKEKTIFRNQRANFLQTPPNVTDVMRLTAQIDQSQKAGGRCYGPRFTKFLHGVQQFAALGDVVVGGSQNIIACGVWSVVRMSLLAIINHSAYLESLSLLLMEASRSYPQHFELASLYPRSRSLQSHLTEYFIVVIQICHRLQSYTQSSSLKRFTSSLNDTDIKGFQSQLSSWSKSISEEIMLLVAKRTEEEAQSNSSFRILLAKASKATSYQQRLHGFQVLLGLCSEYDYETPWRQIRKTGNTKLYLSLPAYKTWKETDTRPTIIFTGKMGSGKSVMLANIVDDLVIHCESRVASVAYFFCRHDLPESLKARTVIGALVRQIVSPFLSNLNNEKFGQHNSLDYDDMIELIRLVHPTIGPFEKYIVLDGLHLCDRSEQETVAKQLQRIQVGPESRCCISLRLEPSLEFISEYLLDPEIVSPIDNTSDIDAFIQEELEGCLTQQTLVIGDPRLILEIHEALSRGSKGMFLWVALQIKSLTFMQTDEEIRNALSDLPQDLSVIYDRILQKCPQSGKQYQKRILELTAAAERPLTTEELREALSVHPGDTVWAAAKLINDIYTTMNSCGPLLIVDEEEHTVRFIHHSVQQFLFNTYTDFEGRRTTIQKCHEMMADILVTYLSYGIFGTEVSTARVPEINIGSAPAKIIQSTVGSSKGAQNLALKLLKLRKCPSFDAGKTIAKELSSLKVTKRQEYHLFEYARTSFLTHVAQIGERSSHIRRLCPDLLQRGDGPGSKLPSFDLAYKKALETDNIAMALTVLMVPQHRWQDEFVVASSTGGGRYYTRLGYAICTDSKKIVDTLIPSLNVYPAIVERVLRTASCEIVYRGYPDVVRMVLESSKAKDWLHHVCECGRRLLACAIWGGNNEVLGLLLETGEIDVNAGPFERSAIWEAVAQNNLEAVRMLLGYERFVLHEFQQLELLSLVGENSENADIAELIRRHKNYSDPIHLSSHWGVKRQDAKWRGREKHFRKV